MVISDVARVYAVALYEKAVAENILKQVEEETVMFFSILKDDGDLKLFLLSPGISKLKKMDFIDRTFLNKFSEVFVSFLKVLVENDRTEIIDEVEPAFDALLDEHYNRQKVLLVSSLPLDKATRESIIAVLNERFKKEVILEEKVDPSILGGIIIKAGDNVIDASLQNRLKQIKERLLKTKVGGVENYEN